MTNLPFAVHFAAKMYTWFGKGNVDGIIESIVNINQLSLAKVCVTDKLAKQIS
jgi:hypothetical protein